MLPARKTLTENPSSGIYPASHATIAIANDCREAALAFVNHLPRGWGKRELAEWLVGPYANATRFAGHVEVTLRDHVSAPVSKPETRSHHELDHDVDERDVEALLRSARLNVMTMLEKMTLSRGQPNQLSFVDTMVSAHYVVSAIIDHRSGWLPSDEPGMRLRARVLSLFAVDALVRPRDYAEALFVCHRCEEVVFDENAVERGFCSAHAS